MMSNGVLAEYSIVEMQFGVLTRNSSVKEIMQPNVNPTVPSRFSYDKLQKHIHNKYVIIKAQALLDTA